MTRRTTTHITGRLTAVFLALVMVVGLLPTAAFAAENNLPDWYFLFAIFKNVDADVTDGEGKTTHQTYTMPQDEIDAYREHAQAFETYMNQVGVMCAHVDVVEIDTPVRELYNEHEGGSYLGRDQAAPLLEGKVDLDRYDHVFCIVSLNVSTRYAGITGSAFSNGTGQTCVNLKNRDSMLKNYSPKGASWSWTPTLYVHEYLHLMERLNKRWWAEFNEHNIQLLYNANLIDGWKACYTDIIRNRVKGNAETGTGVAPAAWQYPPHVLRTTPIPSGVSSIKAGAFSEDMTLTRVYIPASVTNIGDAAFYKSSLTEIAIPSSISSIGGSVFSMCTALTRATIPASITKIGEAAFYKTDLKDVYYGGTEAQWKAIEIGKYNDPLIKAKIHYNSVIEEPETSKPAQSVQFTDVSAGAYYYAPVQWAVAQDITSGISSTTFSPDQTCTQGQILTFLWRAAGSPAPAGAVSGNEYYAKAIQWAKEQELINGALKPHNPCTRLNVVTYLWKLAGSPDAKAASFTDVSTGNLYAKAVNWAVEQGVTAGTSATTFSPDQTCTRGQIVTFLYRAFGK